MITIKLSRYDARRLKFYLDVGMPLKDIYFKWERRLAEQLEKALKRRRR